MSERQPNDWVWTAAVAAACSSAALLAVFYLVIAPQLLDPSAGLRRDADRKQVLDQFRQELERNAEQQRKNQQVQFETAITRLEKLALQRIDGAVERATQRQLSEEFLDELRGRVLDQARQIDPASNKFPALAPPTASAVVDAMLREDLNALNSAKVAVNEYWASTGHAPANNAAAGINEPETFAGQLRRTLNVASNGSIHLALDPRIGVKDAQVVYTSDLDTRTATVNWNCFTNVAAILRIMPLCELRSQLPD